MPGDVLTQEDVNAHMESARLEMEQELANAGPEAVRTLAGISKKEDAKDADRIKASTVIIDQTRGRAAAQEGERDRGGPTIHVTVNQLSTGERRSEAIPVAQEVIDAIQIGKHLIEEIDG